MQCGVVLACGRHVKVSGLCFFICVLSASPGWCDNGHSLVLTVCFTFISDCVIGIVFVFVLNMHCTC